jgi:hypothetical protein
LRQCRARYSHWMLLYNRNLFNNLSFLTAIRLSSVSANKSPFFCSRLTPRAGASLPAVRWHARDLCPACVKSSDLTNLFCDILISPRQSEDCKHERHKSCLHTFQGWKTCARQRCQQSLYYRNLFNNLSFLTAIRLSSVSANKSPFFSSRVMIVSMLNSSAVKPLFNSLHSIGVDTCGVLNGRTE